MQQNYIFIYQSNEKNVNFQILRYYCSVTSEIPDELWRVAIDCIVTGIGSPLISNDDMVVSKLIEFGYDEVDARNYTTSACWELIPGNSCEQNNIGVFDWAIPFDLIGKKENLDELDTWDKFIRTYSVHLCGHANYMAHLTDNIKWEKDPLMSFLLKVSGKL